MTELVFGYGSLVGWEAAGEPPQPARVAGLRRSWTVAMDNRVDLPGYKYYVEPATGTRPAVHVAFVDVADDPDTVLGGVCHAVTPAQLAALDDRERNYARRGVAATLGDGSSVQAWLYVGTPAARRRAAAARGAGELVVQASYLSGLRAGFAARGALAAFERATDRPGCPVVELERRSLP